MIMEPVRWHPVPEDSQLHSPYNLPHRCEGTNVKFNRMLNQIILVKQI